jgi:hypothetical protein
MTLLQVASPHETDGQEHLALLALDLDRHAADVNCAGLAR